MATILIVDGEAAVRRTLYAALGNDHIVLEASNGREGLFLFNLYHPDIVITDLCIAVLAGFSFIERLRTLPHHDRLKIIALTQEETVRQQSGVDLYLSKQSDSDALRAAIARLSAAQPVLNN